MVTNHVKIVHPKTKSQSDSWDLGFGPLGFRHDFSFSVNAGTTSNKSAVMP